MSKFKVSFTMGIPFDIIVNDAQTAGGAKEAALQAFEDLTAEELLSLACDAQIAHGIHIEELPAFYVKAKE